MCGICGVIDWTESADAATVVRRMNATMLHRGPDDEGYLDAGISDFGIRNADFGQRAKSEGRTDSGNRIGGSGGSISIGMRRLSIIDLEGGHQPIFNEAGTVGVVLNGEIYNFRELQQQLGGRGHTFRTRSDSEVVAHAYEEWGPECVERLQGMFALAVWDRRGTGGQTDKFQVSSSEFQVSSSELTAGEGAGDHSQEGGTLFLARDRLGIKPLYYYFAQSARFGVSSSEFRVEQDENALADLALPEASEGSSISKLETRNSKPETGNVFVFASEVRTLLASGLVPRKLSRAAVESYLLFGSVSEPMTLIEGVLSLPPGHRMTIGLDSQRGSANIERYWNIAAPPARNGNASETNSKSAAARVRTLLEESVRSHLIADVPVGVFLSSGIDSTALAALASREVAGVHTFTVAFPEDKFSEAALARQTAERLGTVHQEVMLSGDEMLARLGEAVGALDLPTIDGINTYFVSASARAAGLKVALSGLGGDEVFGGYNTFRRTPRYQRLAMAGNAVPAGMRSAMSAALAEAGGRLVRGDAARKIAALWKNADSLPDPFYFGRLLFTPGQVSALMNGAAPAEHEALWWEWLRESAAQARQLDSFAAVSCLEAQSYLVSTLLRDTDSMSMAHSLEVRVPFLDHALVEFVTHLPQELKLAKGTPKALLVAALGDDLPSEVVHQTKRGFTFPWEAWLRGPLKDKIENGLSELSPALQEVLDSTTARDVWQSYLDGKTTWSRPWSLYVLNEWTKTNLD